MPILLGVAGVSLIIAGSLPDARGPGPSLPPIARPTPSTTPEPTPSATLGQLPTESASPSATASPSAEPTPTPLPDDVVAVQLDVPTVGIMVAVRQSVSQGTDDFPGSDAAYVLRSSSQPGRNESSYIFAHALAHLFKPLWNVQLGAEVRVQMSDGSVLNYVVTEVRPNVACPDPNADPNLNPAEMPRALRIHDDCTEGIFWIQPAPYERLTLQTSQGFNRNWGELIVVAEPTS